MAKKMTDNFPNRAFLRLVQSAANAITFGQLRFGFGVFTGSALVIHRCDFYPTRTSAVEIIANADQLQMGLTNRNDLTSLSPSNMNVLALAEIDAPTVGSATNFQQIRMPWMLSFADMPGGGLIIPSNPLFFSIDSVGFSAPATVDLIMYYTVRQLVDSDYIELVQSLIPVNV